MKLERVEHLAKHQKTRPKAKVTLRIAFLVYERFAMERVLEYIKEYIKEIFEQVN